MEHSRPGLDDRMVMRLKPGLLVRLLGIRCVLSYPGHTEWVVVFTFWVVHIVFVVLGLVFRGHVFCCDKSSLF